MQTSLSSSAVANREAIARRRALPLPVLRPDLNKVAVLLNKRARQVSEQIIREAQAVAGDANVFTSDSLEEAEQCAREIVQRGYGTVVAAGGDGTLVKTINLVQHYVRDANAWRNERYRRYGEWQTLIGMPRFGLLRLGTGNAVSSIVGAGKAMATDLTRILSQSPLRSRQLPVIEVDGEQSFFVGLGFDSLVLNDYNALKERTHSRLLRPLVHSVLGYVLATFTRTLPRVLSGRYGTLEARVINRGRAYYVDPRRGDAVDEVEPEVTIYDGPVTFIGAGTTPFYGYGIKIFPFASLMPGMMNLRVTKISALSAVGNLPSIWKGTYRDPRECFDFIANDVEIELSRPYPFQHSGDAQGERKSLRWKVGSESLELVDLHEPRQIFS